MAKDLAVYVDTSALSSWSTQMSKINEDAKGDLDAFLLSVDSLKDLWEGNSASGFLEGSDNFVNHAKTCHDNMTKVEQFLLDVITTVENE